MALQETNGHVELVPRYNVASGNWQWLTDWLDDDLNSRNDSVDTLCFPGIDSAPASLGVRNVRPAAAKWDFLGMAAGEPVWIFTATSYASAGFSATQPELSGNLSITLDSIQGPAGGVFSMYSGSTPTIYMQTIDGITAADVLQKPSNHTHVNWAFSRKGLWIIRLKAQGTIASSGASTPASTPAPLVFAIGDHARWKTSHFQLTELLNPSISGDAADPDGDNLDNLMEYALGGDPRVSSTRRADDGQLLAPCLLPPASAGAPWRFCYFRRTAAHGTEIAYEVESSNSLGSPPWDGETGSEEILFSNDSWKQICIPLGIPQGAENSCFFRLKVSTMP